MIGPKFLQDFLPGTMVVGNFLSRHARLPPFGRSSAHFFTIDGRLSTLFEFAPSVMNVLFKANRSPRLAHAPIFGLFEGGFEQLTLL